MEEEILENQEIIYVEEDIVDIDIVEGEPSTTISEEVETITIEAPQEVGVEVGEGFGAITSGNGENSHPLLYGRDLKDQHPISAITGLKEKLDSIESLKTLYSDKVGFANYYKWSDGAHDEFGYFVSVVPDSSMIKICEGADIFGVTVDSAAVVGGQDEIIPRDNTYALVATTGLVNVRCELDVEIDSSVVPNGYGIAERTDSGCGYKVVATPKINGTTYATISLGVQAYTTDLMAQKIQRLDDRLYKDEKDIGAAMQVANEAFQKAGESANVSEEALKDALEALKQTEEMGGVIDGFYENLASTNQIAVQAKTLANDAVMEAGRIQKAAYDVANDALTNVNDLVAQMDPITSWPYTDPETGEEFVGAEYFTTYIKDGVATKAEIQTVETLTSENKSMIEKSAEEFSSLISSVDKYSVGEYSQAYGLTRKQAKSILKPGYIYIPTKHKGSESHCEMFVGDNEENWFTPGDYYVWGINDQGNADWIEHSVGSVWISKELPTNSNGRWKYWYINSNEAPDGYESYALYIWEDDKWTKVNTLAGNVNNRITSMIRQDVDEISAEVVNARGGAASLTARIDENEALVQTNAIWMKGETQEGEKLYNLATIQQKADDESSTLALVVADTEGNKVLGGANIVLSQGEDGSFISLDADHIDFTTGDFKIDASHIINLEAPEIDLEGYVTFTDLETDGSTTISGSNIKTGTIDASVVNVKNISADNITSGTIDAELVLAGEVTAENINATGGTIGGCSIVEGVLQIDELIAQTVDANYVSGLECNFKKGSVGGWKLDGNSLYSGDDFGSGSFLCTGSIGNLAIGGSLPQEGWVFKAGSNFGVDKDGATYASEIHLNAGFIAGWEITGDSLFKGSIGNAKSFCVYPDGIDDATAYGIFGTRGLTWCLGVGADFGVTKTGSVYAASGKIAGWNFGKNVEIRTSATTTITIDALYSDEMYEDDGMTYQVYLTPKGVYVYGREATGESYYNHKKWYML